MVVRMGNKPWADEPKPSPWHEFFGWTFAGLMTSLTAIAWIPIKFGMNAYLVYGICVTGSIALGISMARDALRELEKEKQEKEKNNKRTE